MSTSDDRHDEQPTVVRLPDLLAQVHNRAAETVGHDVEAGTARLTAWMGRQRQQTELDDSAREPLPAAAPPIDPTRPTRRKRPRTSITNRRVRVHADAASVGKMTARSARRNGSEDLEGPLHRDSIRLGLGVVHAQARVGPMLARMARVLAHAVVAVVALLHDTQWAIVGIGGLGIVYLTTLAVVTVVSVGYHDSERRADSRRVLRLLLGREDGDHVGQTGDTYITVNGKAVIRDD
jgi:hypothetical protein